MEKTADQIVKKTWSKPQIIVIATSDIEGGVSPGLHEGQFISSSVTVGGHYLLFKNITSPGVPANHNRNAYYS